MLKIKNGFFSDFELEKHMCMPAAFVFILNADQTLQ